MKESIKLCVFILSFLFSFSVEAENKLKIKYDDGEIIEWRMSENFKPDVIITDDGPHLRLTGQHSLIFLPAVYTEWTFRDNNDLVIVQGNWYDWGYGDDYYTLEEIGNNVILGNLPEDTDIMVFIGEEETTCRLITVSDQLAIDPTDGYNNYCFNGVGFEILPR